jgi:DNA/RNA endonuclease YhcR with UshA esterase domain
MRRILKLTFFILLVSLVAACQPQQPSATPYPTYTPYPTFTPYPTYTPVAVTRPSLPSDEVEGLIWPNGPRDDVIPAEDAADFMREKIVVEGKIARTHNAGSAVFLNFSPETNDKAFTAVIFPDDWPKFPAAPENLFAGKLVRVEGIIEEYQGAPEIIIKDPGQIEVALTLGQPVISNCDCQAAAAAIEPPTATAILQPPTVTPIPIPADMATSEPVTTPTSEPAITPEATSEPVAPAAEKAAKAISWQKAAGYTGQTVTVEGQVVDTYNSGKTVFLNFDKDYRNSFKVVIFAKNWPLFPAPPEDYYRQKTIRVTGPVELYQNAPEIIVDRPDQIELVE